MDVEIISPMYNEEYLLPIFLEHYKFADEITFFYDTDTTDKSLEIINKHKKTDVVIREFNTGDGMNDYFMIDLLNEKLKNTSMDYSICVDMDELLFHTNKNFETHGEDIKNYISEDQCDFYHACFYQMYPHHTEKNEIFQNVPIWDQRKYGGFSTMYIKPCILKKDSGFKYVVGKHYLYKEIEGDMDTCINRECVDFEGCHLNNINIELSICRRLQNRKERMSKVNTERGVCAEYYNLTEEMIRVEFLKEYPKLW